MSFVAQPMGVTSMSSMPLETMTSMPLQDSHVNGGSVFCRRCRFPGCDIKLLGCGCSVHARCISVTNIPLQQCPYCLSRISGVALYPMSFSEIDRARQKDATVKSSKRSKKRKEPGTGADDQDSSCRTGRWTQEEMAFCDKLIETFKAGELPVTNGVKLNDFLATMLKSKQSRLTKKMKNANLSGKIFKLSSGFIADVELCKKFSEVEDSFLTSLNDPLEKASVRFHMQKEWREMFSSFCVSLGQPLDADSWLSSVEEMEKRESLAKDAARMARRKMMMGIALNQDTQNPDQGVFIERTSNVDVTASYDNNFCLDHDDLFSILSDKPFAGGAKLNGRPNHLAGERHYWHYSSPFLGKVISYIQRHACPFEHVDVWVPSFVPDSEASEGSGTNVNSTCRLCFAGSATADVQISPDNMTPAQMMSQDEQFHLLSFGDYSQKFSFNVGCGLPGRVYENGVPAWEQSVHNAPHHHFERCGGAIQWGIKTVVGIPVPSPNVGRIVVVLYSKYDRNKDQELVGRLYDEFKKMVPSPKWKLVVDIGKPNLPSLKTPSQGDLASAVNPGHKFPITQDAQKADSQGAPSGRDPRIDELVALLGEQMPHDPQSPYATHLQHFMSLRLMMLKPTRTKGDKEVEDILLSSYASYKSSGRDRSDIAVMIARDYTFLQHQATPSSKPQAQSTSNAVHNGSAQAPAYYHANQSQSQPFNVPQPQQLSMDVSNHSVVGIGQPPQQNCHQSNNMMEISNHSHIQLNHHPTSTNATNHQMMHSAPAPPQQQQQPHP